MNLGAAPVALRIVVASRANGSAAMTLAAARDRTFGPRNLLVHRQPRVHTPLRLEYHRVLRASIEKRAYDNNLRCLGKPAEFFPLPEGAHQNHKTYSACAPMQGAVEWMNFWLKGYEDEDPQREGLTRTNKVRSLQQEDVRANVFQGG